MKLHGHRQYGSSDFGHWSCRWCGAHGDDFGPDPTDVPCELVDHYRLLRYDGPPMMTALAEGTLAEVVAAAAQLDLPPTHKYTISYSGRPEMRDPAVLASEARGSIERAVAKLRRAGLDDDEIAAALTAAADATGSSAAA